MPSLHADSFARLSDVSLEAFTQRHDARERGLRISRQVIRLSANAIRAVHRSEFDRASDLIAQARADLQECAPILQTNPEIYHAGYMADARKEFSEANITLALLSGQALPQPEDIGVDPTAYLKGLGDVAGELRRYILDSLRWNRWQRCEEVMEVLDDIYSLLATMDFPGRRHDGPPPHHRHGARHPGAHPRRLHPRPQAALPGGEAGRLDG